MASIRARIRRTVKPFEFQPFSAKQLKVMTWWNADFSPYAEFDGIIGDGSIRSGKTVSMALSFVIWAMNTFDGQNFAICGKTIRATERNVMDPLKKMIKGKGLTLVEVRNENLYIIVGKKPDGKGGTAEIVNYFYIFGGKDEGSQDLIQGITLAGAFFDEVALMPESFVNQATGRHSVDGSKFWFSCNPSTPFHWFKKNWINKRESKKLLYLHFTMDDNPSLSEKIRKRYESLYTGVFYERYILGLWVGVEGVIYPMFKESTHVKQLNLNWTRTFVSIDFGINNPTTFGIYGYHAPTQHYHLMDTYYHNGRLSHEQFEENSEKRDRMGRTDLGYKSTSDYAKDLVKFIIQSGQQIEYIIVDPSASALIIDILRQPYIKRKKIEVIPAANDVMKGIQFHSFLLSAEKFTVDPQCEEDIEEYGEYAWNEKKADEGIDEVLKDHDHCMDRNRYATFTDALLNDTHHVSEI